jgi:hypothetical protein
MVPANYADTVTAIFSLLAFRLIRSATYLGRIPTSRSAAASFFFAGRRQWLDFRIGIQVTWNATEVFQRVYFGIGNDARILHQHSGVPVVDTARRIDRVALSRKWIEKRRTPARLS